LSSHPAWAALLAPAQPLYCLPEQAISALAQMRGKSPAVLSGPEAQAERAFTALCCQYHAVGCCDDRPVSYDFLSLPAEGPAPSLMQKLGWTRQQQSQIGRALRTAGDAALRLKGYAGWLLTEPAFLREAGELTDRWVCLPSGQRPPLPIARPFSAPTSPEDNLAPPALADFLAAARTFLDRWGLTHMATWDLPAPQGPLLPNPLPAGAPALPSHGVHLVLPLHYPLQGDDGLLRQVLEFQRQSAREQGLDDSLAGLPHYKAYAAMLDVLHLERCIRARRRPGRPVPGLVTLMEGAIAEALGGSLARVQKLRKAVAACRRGHRARVAWLRARAR
jgi:hypothetical protein